MRKFWKSHFEDLIIPVYICKVLAALDIVLYNFIKKSEINSCFVRQKIFSITLLLVYDE